MSGFLVLLIVLLKKKLKKWVRLPLNILISRLMPMDRVEAWLSGSVALANRGRIHPPSPTAPA
jgi:hypothetical protein